MHVLQPLSSCPPDGASVSKGWYARRAASLGETLRSIFRGVAVQRKRQAARLIAAYLQKHDAKSLRELGYTDAQIACIRRGQLPFSSE
jgi:hypothetical protein